MKTYKVVSYVANVSVKDTTLAVAERLETIINDFSAQGWSFESIEKFETAVTDPGCMGFNAKTATNFIQLIIFSK